MKHTLALIALFAMSLSAPSHDKAKLASLVAPSIERGGVVTIPPGDYEMDGAKPLTIGLRMTVFAYTAAQGRSLAETRRAAAA